MRSLIFPLALCLAVVPCYLAAEEAIEIGKQVAEATDMAPWLQILLGVLSTLCTAVLLPWMRNRAKAAQAEADRASMTALAESNQNRHFLIDRRIIPFLWSAGCHMIDTELPALVDKLKAGEMSWQDLREHFIKALTASAKEKFEAEGVDVAVLLGAGTLRNLVERAVDKWMPVPSGLKDPKSWLLDIGEQMLVEHGTQYLRGYIGTSTSPALDAIDDEP